MAETGGDAATCERLLRGGSRSFFAASLVLPARVREPAVALYAFCRVADDAIDLVDDKDRALAGLRQRLDGLYAGRAGGHAADRAFAEAARCHRIPRELPEALFEGFLWDAQGRQYETIEDLHAYGARVAGSVGAMMALVMGAGDPGVLARACELGVAMQLTNIARDVGEDARAGRLYLPRRWMREAGIDPDAWLARPCFDDRVAAVVQRLLTEADRLYRRAEPGIAALPSRCRPAIMAARLVYAEIGRELERRRLDSVHARAVVARRRQVALVLRALGAVVPGWRAPRTDLPPLEAVRHLVQASTRAGVWAPPRSLEDKVAWLVALFLRLADRDRALAIYGRDPGPQRRGLEPVSAFAASGKGA